MRDELHKTLTADISRLIGSLDWALRWIEFCAEVPTGDEPDDLEQFQTAKALLAPPPSPARVEEGSVNG